MSFYAVTHGQLTIQQHCEGIRRSKRQPQRFDFGVPDDFVRSLRAFRNA